MLLHKMIRSWKHLLEYIVSGVKQYSFLITYIYSCNHECMLQLNCVTCNCKLYSELCFQFRAVKRYWLYLSLIMYLPVPFMFYGFLTKPNIKVYVCFHFNFINIITFCWFSGRCRNIRIYIEFMYIRFCLKIFMVS